MIRVGLVGYGFVGRLMHAPYIMATPEFELTVVGSSRKDEVLRKYPTVEVVPEYVKVCQHPSVDLVVIATPNLSHYELCKAAINASKSVVCDKPFVASEMEARELQKLAESKRVILSVFQNRRFDSDFKAIRQALKDNLIGDPRIFESRIDRFRPDIRDRWREHPIPCSGVWWDLGPHVMDQILCLFGVPKSITLSLGRLRGIDQADDFAHAVVDYPNMNLKCVCHMSMCAQTHLSPRFTVHGSRGSLQKFQMDQQEAQLLSGMSPTNSEFGCDTDKLKVFDSDGHESVEECPRGDHVSYYRQIAASIHATKPNPVLPIQAVVLMHILQGAERAAKQGKVFEVNLKDQEIEEFIASQHLF